MAKIITAKQAAELLQVDYLTMLIYLRTGQIPGRKIGKEWRLLDADLEAFVSSGSAKEEPTDLKK